MPDIDPPTVNEGFVFTRTLPLSEPTESGLLKRHIQSLAGVVTVTLDNRRLRVRYDASRLHIDRIVECIEQAGAYPEPGLWSRLRLRWYRYVDANAAQNAGRTDIHCCNKPPRGH